METRLEKVRQMWRRAKPFFLGCLVLAAVAGVIMVLIYVPKMQVPVPLPGQEGLPTKQCFDIENEARRTLSTILAGGLAIIGIYMAFRRIRALERQVLLGRESQITDRFTKAIDHLGSQEKMAVRLGGIYALERLAKDSDKDYWPIMETLTAYVRDNAPWREPATETREAAAGPTAAVGETATPTAAATSPPATTPPAAGPPAPATPKPATDIQAILTVLGRRRHQYGQGETQPLDMRGTDLAGADLKGVHLEGAVLMGAHLEGADLREAHLKEADLYKAHLAGADLSGACLEKAHLTGARLEKARLGGAHLAGAILVDALLQRARLSNANLEGAYLMHAHLEVADLTDAHLEGANLEGACLKGAYLTGAHLEGADLSGTTGLIREQLEGAIMDDTTRLPDKLRGTPPGDKGPERDQE